MGLCWTVAFYIFPTRLAFLFWRILNLCVLVCFLIHLSNTQSILYWNLPPLLKSVNSYISLLLQVWDALRFQAKRFSWCRGESCEGWVIQSMSLLSLFYDKQLDTPPLFVSTAFRAFYWRDVSGFERELFL